MFLICRCSDFLLLLHLESILASPPIFVLFSLFHDDSNTQFHVFPWLTPNTNPEPSAENIEEQWWVVMKQSNKQVRITVKQLYIPVLKISQPYPQMGFLTCFPSQSSWPPAMVISPSLARFFSYFSSLPASNPAHSHLFPVHLDCLHFFPVASPGGTLEVLWSNTPMCVWDKGLSLFTRSLLFVSGSNFSPVPPHTTFLLQQSSLDTQQSLLGLFWIKGWMSLLLTSVCYLAQASPP